MGPLLALLASFLIGHSHSPSVSFPFLPYTWFLVISFLFSFYPGSLGISFLCRRARCGFGGAVGDWTHSLRIRSTALAVRCGAHQRWQCVWLLVVSNEWWEVPIRERSRETERNKRKKKTRAKRKKTARRKRLQEYRQPKERKRKNVLPVLPLSFLASSPSPPWDRVQFSFVFFFIFSFSSVLLFHFCFFLTFRVLLCCQSASSKWCNKSLRTPLLVRISTMIRRESYDTALIHCASGLVFFPRDLVASSAWSSGFFCDLQSFSAKNDFLIPSTLCQLRILLRFGEWYTQHHREVELSCCGKDRHSENSSEHSNISTTHNSRTSIFSQRNADPPSHFTALHFRLMTTGLWFWCSSHSFISVFQEQSLLPSFFGPTPPLQLHLGRFLLHSSAGHFFCCLFPLRFRSVLLVSFLIGFCVVTLHASCSPSWFLLSLPLLFLSFSLLPSHWPAFATLRRKSYPCSTLPLRSSSLSFDATKRNEKSKRGGSKWTSEAVKKKPSEKRRLEERGSWILAG